MNNLMLEGFPLITFDKIRYADTDRQGHVNNANFASFLETGRVELLYSQVLPVLSDGASFVLASLSLNFLKEIVWPGQVDIGTGILRVGNSSIRIYQKLYQNHICVADAETTIVQVDNASGQAKPLSVEAKNVLAGFMLRDL